MISKVISGGQTGADMGGLIAAERCGIPTGGTAPKGYRTECGSCYELRDRFGLEEDSIIQYESRTEKNIKDSDGTVIYGDISSPGSKKTFSLARVHKKPVIINPDTDELVKWIQNKNIEILNVAGNRESKNPGICEQVTEKLIQVLNELVKK